MDHATRNETMLFYAYEVRGYVLLLYRYRKSIQGGLGYFAMPINANAIAST